MAGYYHNSDLNSARMWICKTASEASSPYNDGFTASGYKKQLYEIKCLIEDLYPDLPTFVGEDEWEKERLIQKLKKK
jgi:hypothetical protein